MKLILAGLILFSLRAAAEDIIAEPDDGTQGKAAVVEEVCAGTCNKKQSAPLVTKPVKAKYKESLDTINQVDREVKKPEEIQKDKAKPEEPFGV